MGEIIEKLERAIDAERTDAIQAIIEGDGTAVRGPFFFDDTPKFLSPVEREIASAVEAITRAI